MEDSNDSVETKWIMDVIDLSWQAMEVALAEAKFELIRRVREMQEDDKELQEQEEEDK